MKKAKNYYDLVEYLSSRGCEVYSGVSGSSHYHGYRLACKKYKVDYEKIDTGFLFYKSGKIIGSSFNMVSSLVSHNAAVVSFNKMLTYRVLREGGVKIPRSYLYDRPSRGEAVDLFLNDPALSVIKPFNGRGGEDVSLGVDNERSFLHFFDKIIASGSKILMQEFAEGFDCRAVVVDGEVVSAVTRVPAYVIGDGRKNVAELVEEKNNKRNEHPHHKRFLIRVPDFDIALKKGEVFFMDKISNIHLGGEAVDVTDIIGSGIKKTAVSAVRSIPGCGAAGVDLLINGFEDCDPTVIEINVAANFGIHYYPYFGTSRNPADAIIKSMVNN